MLKYSVETFKFSVNEIMRFIGFLNFGNEMKIKVEQGYVDFIKDKAEECGYIISGSTDKEVTITIDDFFSFTYYA